MASEVRHGDCLEVVRGLAAESLDLVYVDPPFFTQKTHALVTRDRTTTFQFSDEWKSRTEYIEFLRVRLQECRRVLKATGSLFFHCDTNASHHIRSLLDEVFDDLSFLLLSEKESVHIDVHLFSKKWLRNRAFRSS